MSRTVLVLGGTGFLGRHLVARLVASGDRVARVVGDRATDDLGRVKGTFDAVVDLVGFDGLDIERAIDVFAGRVGHYLFVSTGQVYLVREDPRLPSREEDYDGRVIPRPEGRDGAQWDYGTGKRACEDALARAHERLPSTRLRIPIVNGPGDNEQRIARYIRQMLGGAPLRAAFLDRRVRHVDAQEVARTIDCLLGDARVLGEAVNQTQDETPTLRELLEMLGAELGARPTLVDDETATSDVSPFSTRWMSFLDPAKLRALGIGHAPLATTLARCVGHVVATL